jgi:hypothetical protein
MSAKAIALARSFVQQADLPAARRPRRPTLGAAAPAPPPGEQSPFDSVKQQAAVVGSDVISFVTAITPEQRKDLVNASLLAQLVANRKVGDPEDLKGILEWYKRYFDVLSHLGFVIQSQGFATYTEKAGTFEAHEAIIDIVTAVLGASAPAALPIVLRTLDSLKKLSDDSPWITLFHRESRSAHTARFQVSLADSEPNGSFLNLFAFGIEAKATITQVLFFKFEQNESTLQHNSSKLTINDTVLTGVRDDITRKIAKFTKDFVAGLEL